MTLTTQAREALAHPFTKLSAVVSLLGAWGFGWFEPAWALISSTSSFWFPAIAVSAGEILPRLGYGGIAGPVLLGGAIVFVAVQLDRLKDRAVSWYNNR